VQDLYQVTSLLYVIAGSSPGMTVRSDWNQTNPALD
jgi:hypothetical protein